MNKIIKLIRATEDRVSRFHTARGQLMPFNAWLRLPRAILDRVLHLADDNPWIAPEAVSFLKATIKEDWKIFEFGSGWSTLFYASRAGSVISLEHDPAWYDRIGARITTGGISNCDLRLVELDGFPNTIKAFKDDSFNLIVVDCDEWKDGEGRLSCIAAAKPKVLPGGYLMVDDSDRPEYQEAEALLSGWKKERIVGVKPFPLHAVETTLFRRPFPL
jgi:predicted O-methyltransferase YrrM